MLFRDARQRAGRRLAALLLAMLTTTVLAGCYHRVQRAMDCYHDDACALRLGMSEEDFVAATRDERSPTVESALPTAFARSGTRFTVHYLPAAAGPGSAVADEAGAENRRLVPYLFRERRLVAVGWDPLDAVYGPGDDLARTAVTGPDPGTLDADASDAPANAEEPTLLNRGPYKWCVPDLTGSGRCSNGPCC